MRGLRFGAVTRASLTGLLLLLAPDPTPAGAADAIVRVKRDQAARAVQAAVLGAELRLAQPRCRRLLQEFKDEAGRPLQAQLDALGHTAEAHLHGLLFYDGWRIRRCAGDVDAVTARYSAVVFICPGRFERTFKDNPALAESYLIHEMLHTLGLGENPPTSREITDRVIEACS